MKKCRTPQVTARNYLKYQALAAKQQQSSRQLTISTTSYYLYCQPAHSPSIWSYITHYESIGIIARQGEVNEI